VLLGRGVPTSPSAGALPVWVPVLEIGWQDVQKGTARFDGDLRAYPEAPGRRDGTPALFLTGVREGSNLSLVCSETDGAVQTFSCYFLLAF